MSNLMLLAVLIQFHLYISYASASTIKHKINANQDIALNQRPAAAGASLIMSSIASHMINDLTGRALDPGNLLPRDDKMDDLFYSQSQNDLGGQKDSPDRRDEKVEQGDNELNGLQLGDLTKTVDLEQLKNFMDEPELVVSNHQVTSEGSVPVASNSRHYSNYQPNSISNTLFANSHQNQPQQNHNPYHYVKYSPNMFANNYNLNYIHSFLTNKPSLSPNSFSLQTMQSLLNSNPGGLTLAPHNLSPSSSSLSSSAGPYVSASSSLSASAYQPSGVSNLRGQQVHYLAPLEQNVTQQNGPNTLSADFSSTAHCGRQQVAYREPRIVGGNSTYEGEFPWAVSIQRHGNHHCGGVIVGHKWILTAAHCVRSQAVGNLMVRTGGHTLTRSINSINAHLEHDFSVEQIIMHDDFSRYDNLTSSQLKSSASTNNADIALLKLKQEIKWNEHAWPVCFPNRDAGNFSGQDAIVVGWGKLSEKSEEFSNELQKVKLTIIDNKVCQNWFRQAGRDMAINDRIICAGFKSGGKDACHGDSGGPLLSRLNGQYVVVGVVSTGIGCARPLLPGLYSRVSSYIGWIERYITY